MGGADLSEGLLYDCIYIKCTTRHKPSVIIEVPVVVTSVGAVGGVFMTGTVGGNLPGDDSALHLGLWAQRCLRTLELHTYDLCSVQYVFTHQL